MLSKGSKVSALSFRTFARFGLRLVSGLPECRFDRGARGGLAECPFGPLQ